jgi:probable F420-dependent oxidoreductase
MTVAVASWDLQKMSDGRFELGLGTQIKTNIEQRYSARWGSPVPQLREYVQSVKAIFHSFQTGERLDFRGEHYEFTRLQPFFNPGPIDYPDVPILCGAVGPDMTKMVGRIADGMITHPTNTPPRYIREICLPRLRSGFHSASRSEDEFRLILAPLTATGSSKEGIAAEWEKQRALLAFLFSTPAYWPSLELLGWRQQGQQLLDMTRCGQWEQMPEILTDEILEAFVPRGTYDEIAEVYFARYAGLTRRVTFPMPDNPDQDSLAADAIARLKAGPQPRINGATR